MIQGKCHCGNVKLSIHKLTDTGTSCNCSICSRYASIWGYFTEAEVNVSIGKYGITTYCYGDKMINFNHCTFCGCITHYTSINSGQEERLAVNYRMFSSEVLDQIKVRFFDGADTWKYIE